VEAWGVEVETWRWRCGSGGVEMEVGRHLAQVKGLEALHAAQRSCAATVRPRRSNLRI
jgi:hypothetical protein